MANGKNEPVQFTRGDAERLQSIATVQQALCKKSDTIIIELQKYTQEVKANTRFRKAAVKILLWVVTPGVGLSGLVLLIIQMITWLQI